MIYSGLAKIAMSRIAVVWSAAMLHDVRMTAFTKPDLRIGASWNGGVNFHAKVSRFFHREVSHC
jgi:hypothetical protein